MVPIGISMEITKGGMFLHENSHGNVSYGNSTKIYLVISIEIPMEIIYHGVVEKHPTLNKFLWNYHGSHLPW